MERLGVIRDIICRLTGVLERPSPGDPPRPANGAEDPLPMIIARDFGFGYSSRTWPWDFNCTMDDLDNKAPWDYLVHGPKGKGEQIHVHYFWYYWDLIYGLGL